jgi:hypothetical protein
VTSLRVIELARRFWTLAGGEPAFPRVLRGALTWALPVTVVELGGLRLSQVVTWLAARGLRGPLAEPSRPLRAAVVARAEQGLIFLDSDDPDDERQFSLAHEVAHYLMESWELREQVALRVGRPALEVLDGQRSPSQAERVDAVLAGLELRPALHLMERTATGHLPDQRLSTAERLADELALELLAPLETVEPLAGETIAQLPALLQARFGLPATLATIYAARLAPAPAPGAEFLTRLGLPRFKPVSHFAPSARKEE